MLSSPAARPLVEEVVRLLGRRGAYPLVRLSFAMEQVPFRNLWAQEAPLSLLEAAAPADREAWRQADAWINIGAPENTRDGSDLSPEREALLDEAGSEFLARRLKLEIPWVTCRYPTPALAQDAGMTTAEFEDFLYGSILLDWDAEGERMARFKERFDAADEVRIVGHETDIRLSLAGREGAIDDGHLNLPGGEFFYSPVEDATEGVITYSEFPAVEEPHVVENARLVFSGGRVVDASASVNEEALFSALDRDEGARVLGELGIGCNPGSSGTCGTRCSTRRSTGRCTSRSARASRRSAGRTGRPCTGTWSRTSGSRVGSSATARSCKTPVAGPSEVRSRFALA